MQKIFALVFFFCFLSFTGNGQTVLPDSVYHLNILPDTGKITIGKIILKGNKITKDKIILRELEFNEGDKLEKRDFEQKLVLSRQNLLNISLFNFVTFTSVKNNNAYDIVIEVVERWYIWPIPIVEFADRNFNVWWETKDFSRLNYGIDLRFENFRGNREYLNFILKTGYDKTLALIWEIPYLNKKQTWGMSVAGGAVYNHETAVNTIDNRLEYFNSQDEYVKKHYFSWVNINFRPKYRFLHSFLLEYDRLDYHDSVLVYNPDFTYGSTSYNYFSFKYKFKLDYRDYKPYPLEGYYFDISFTKKGLGILSKDVNVSVIQTAFDQYIKLRKRFYFAYNFSAMLSAPSHQPYFVSTGLGYNRIEIRGYDLYVVNGQNIGLMKSNFKYEIMPRKNFVLPWIKSEKFSKIFFAAYLNLFFDVAYVSDVATTGTNPMANQMLWSTGAGIDVITYYDLVFRMEYAYIKQGKTGIFLSLTAPI